MSRWRGCMSVTSTSPIVMVPIVTSSRPAISRETSSTALTPPGYTFVTAPRLMPPMAAEDTAGMALTKLGNPDAAADGVLEAFDVDDTALEIVLDCAEFTCRCPITTQPDW